MLDLDIGDEWRRGQGHSREGQCPGKMPPWKPSPLGKALTLTIHDRNGSWIPADTRNAQRSIWEVGYCVVREGLREKAVSWELWSGPMRPGKNSCVVSRGAGEKHFCTRICILACPCRKGSSTALTAGQKCKSGISLQPPTKLCGNGHTLLLKQS